jgi:hypothetical protein
MCCAPMLAPFHNPTPALNQMQLICGWFESIDPQVQKKNLQGCRERLIPLELRVESLKDDAL